MGGVMKKILNVSMSLILVMELFEISNSKNSVEEIKVEENVNLAGLECNNKLKDPMTCMACQIYFESRGESEAGQLAVAQVTMKRANNNTQYVCAKVFEKRKKVCQFSWACEDEPKIMRNPAAAKKAVEIAQQAFEEGAGRFDHFYATYIPEPNWASQMHCERIGKHVFCDGGKTSGYKKVPAAFNLASF